MDTITCCEKKLAEKLKAKGINCCLQIYNGQEHVYVRRDSAASGDSSLYGAEVISPATALAAANATTIRDRMQKWSVITAEGTGKHVDPGPLRNLGKAIDKAPWVTNIMQKDKAGVNACIVSLEQKYLDVMYAKNVKGEFNEHTLLDIWCLMHSGVLSMKPLIETQGVSGRLVRLSNQLEGGRRANEYQGVVEQLVIKGFRYVPCDELPEECVQWRAEKLHLLRHTRGLRDLSPEDELLVAQIDAGPVDSDLVFHHCTPDCPLGCRHVMYPAKFAASQAKKSAQGSSPPLL